MKKITDYILSNLDAFVSIVVSIIAVVYGISGQKTDSSILLAAIAAILAVISFGTIRDRSVRRELINELNKLKEEPSDVIKFFRRNSFASLDETLNDCEEIAFVGISLVNIVSRYGSDLKKKVVEKGGKVTLIFLDPNSNALDASAFWLRETEESVREDIEYTIGRLEKLGKHGFELNMVKSLPGYSMVLIDPDKEKGKIIVEFHTYLAGLNERPHIKLSKNNHKEWYEFFKEQFIALKNN